MALGVVWLKRIECVCERGEGVEVGGRLREREREREREEERKSDRRGKSLGNGKVREVKGRKMAGRGVSQR